MRFSASCRHVSASARPLLPGPRLPRCWRKPFASSILLEHSSSEALLLKGPSPITVDFHGGDLRTSVTVDPEMALLFPVA